MLEHDKIQNLKPVKIIYREGSGPDMLSKNPLVSVHMITYNHEKYIAEAIEGVLIQKTSFRIELVIGEDCSTDSTREICEEYANKYPEIIRLLPSVNNLGMMQNGIRTLEACTGKYIAFCEGDDYWTDPYKLQKQLDFMETNPDCSLCFHAAEQVYDNMSLKKTIRRPKRITKNGKYSIKHAILGGGSFMTTASMFFRADLIREYPEWCIRSPVGDIALMLVLAERGKIGYLDDVMCVYRALAANSWSRQMAHWERQRQHYHAVSHMYREFDAWTEHRHSFYVNVKLLKNRYFFYRNLVARIMRRIILPYISEGEKG